MKMNYHENERNNVEWALPINRLCTQQSIDRQPFCLSINIQSKLHIFPKVNHLDLEKK